jgi:hypothetical protein
MRAAREIDTGCMWINSHKALPVIARFGGYKKVELRSVDPQDDARCRQSGEKSLLETDLGTRRAIMMLLNFAG